ncbi:clampless1 Clp1 protein [Mycena floridula]|nr:clampless1 Clp1 protein [Mycena floridula]
MVLRANRVNRLDENLPPALTSHVPKSLSSRLRSGISEVARRRRARVTGSPHAPKYTAEQARRRQKSKTPSSSIRFKVSTAPAPSADVEMKDAEPSTSGITSTNVVLPKELGRPEYREVSKEALAAVAPDLASEDGPPLEAVRDMLAAWGPEMLRVLAGTTAAPATDSLPDELAIMVSDMTSWEPPTHLMAIYGPKKVPGQPTSVKLYPVHSIVLAANCARLPPLSAPVDKPSSFPQSSLRSSCPQQLMARVQPLCLPSPQTYPQLSAYLYTKRISIICSEPFLPRCSQKFEPSQPSLSFAAELAQKYTGQSLLQHVSAIHGLWQNVCALGIFDDELWEAMDAIWSVLLTALAIGTGNPGAMIPPREPSTSPTA